MPGEIIALLLAFAPLFSRSVFAQVQLLVIGAILASRCRVGKIARRSIATCKMVDKRFCPRMSMAGRSADLLAQRVGKGARDRASHQCPGRRLCTPFARAGEGMLGPLH